MTDGRAVEYDQLVIATGTSPRPDQTPGMDDPAIGQKSVFDFFTLTGSVALREALRNFQGGRLVVHISETSIRWRSFTSRHLKVHSPNIFALSILDRC